MGEVTKVFRPVTVAAPGTPCGWDDNGREGGRHQCASGRPAVHVLTETLPVAVKGTALCAPHSPFDPTDAERAAVAASTFEGKTAAEWRGESQRSTRAAHDSFERCDTDGFLSQWAHGKLSQENSLKARIAENGGVWEFPAIFDLSGNLITAEQREGQYGWYYLNRDSDSNGLPRFITVSSARKGATRERNDRKKGFVVGSVSTVPVVRAAGDIVSLSYYCAIPTGAKLTVVDNGQGVCADRYQDWN